MVEASISMPQQVLSDKKLLVLRSWKPL